MNIISVALKNLRRKPVRTSLLFAIVAVVSCTLFSSTLFLRSISNALRIGTYRLGADILVVPDNAESKARSALISGEPTSFTMDHGILDKVRAVDGVRAATPQLFIKPASFTCCYNVDVFLIAFDPKSDFTIKPWLERNLKRPLGLKEIITGRMVPVITGDQIPFFGTIFSVAGTMEPTGMDFFDRAVVMSMDAAYRMAEDSPRLSPQPLSLGRDRISTVLVQVADDVGPDRVAIRIEHAIDGIRAISSDAVTSTVRKQLSGLIHAILIISLILWLIVLLIMSFAFTMIVNERKREIGLLRSMGATKQHVTALIVIEAATLALLGGAAGMLSGVALLLSLKNALLQYLKLPYLFPAAADLLYLVAAALGFALITGIAAALLPAVSTWRQEPYEAIRSAE